MLNTTKTQCVFVDSKGLVSQTPPNTCLQVADTKMLPSCSLKNLGVYFDSHITFNTHVNKMSKKIFSTILHINRSKDCFNRRAIITLVQTLVLSIINYGIRIWGTTNITLTQQTQKLQNFAAKVTLSNGAKFDHATPFLRELGWLKGIITYNIIHGNIPNHLFCLPRVSDVCTAPTRQQHNVYEPNTNTCTGARSLLVEGPKFWRCLPSSIRNAPSIRTYKKKKKKLLFTYLFNKQFTVQITSTPFLHVILYSILSHL